MYTQHEEKEKQLGFLVGRGIHAHEEKFIRRKLID